MRNQLQKREQTTCVVWGFFVPILFYAILFYSLPGANIIKRMENFFLDERMRKTPAPSVAPDTGKKSSPVYILEIDEGSKKTLPELFKLPGTVGVLDRRIHANGIKLLSEMGAKVIAFDLIFDEPSLPEADRKLEEAIKYNGKIVLASFLDPKTNKILPLYAPFSNANPSIGFVNVFPDPNDGTYRKIIFSTKGERHFVLKILEHFINKKWVDSRFTSEGIKTIRYFSPHQIKNKKDTNSSYEYSYKEKYDNSYKDNFDHSPYLWLFQNKIKPEEINGRIVLVGDASLTGHDYLKTPLSAQMNGVYINAYALQTFLDKGGKGRVREMPFWANAMITIVLSIITASKSRRISFSSGWFWPFTIWMGSFLVSFILYPFLNIEVNMAVSFLSMPLVFSPIIIYRYLTTEKEVKKIKDTFESYVSPEALNEILNRKDILTPEGSLKNMTVLFTDIRGFTTLSEKLHPEEVVRLLRSFFEIAGEVILQYGGHINKLTGDGIMALFSIPPQDDDAKRATMAALKILEEIKRFNENQAGTGRVQLSIGIGLNTGIVIWGEVGFKKKLDYTAIGDTVNVASRLETLTKEYPSPVLISHSTWDKLGELKDKIQFTSYGEVNIRGKIGGIEIYGTG